jgi:uncharacterized protein
MDKLKYLYLSWNTLHDTIHKLSNKIEKDYKPDLIVAIARGGLTIAHIMSDFLELPITTFTVSSYKDQRQISVPKITLHLGNKLHNRKILLVDNISDTGKTFIRGIEYLKENGASEIKSACPYIKPWTKFIPDYYQESVTEWVIFPFDMKENIVSLAKQMRKKGFTDKKIANMLTKIKIPKSFIDYYLPT